MKQGMKQGTVKWFRGCYGFLTPNGGGVDVFVHQSAIEGPGFRTLHDGERVEYKDQDGPKGRRATRVVRVDPDDAPLSSSASAFDSDQRRG